MHIGLFSVDPNMLIVNKHSNFNNKTMPIAVNKASQYLNSGGSSHI